MEQLSERSQRDLHDGRRRIGQGTWRARLIIALLFLVSAGAGRAHAQSALEVVEKLNAEAMEAFTNLDIDRAGSMLEEALRVAVQGQVTGRPLALANLNLGIVYVAGLNDVQAGTGYFVAAVCADPAVELDPLHNSPEIEEAFNQAKEQAAAGGGCADVAALPEGQPSLAVEPIVHVPPAEQQTQTPLPIYVQIAPGLGVSRVVLSYKSLGMDDFKRVDMVHYQQGAAYQISCNDVFEPAVSYYIHALDDAGNAVASMGSAAEPLSVTVATGIVSAPPALPGASPPLSCVGGECPPGMECDRPGTAAMGESCAETPECQSGLACDEGACRLAGGGEVDDSEGFSAADDDETPWGSRDDDEDAGPDPEFSRIFIDFSFVLGMPWVTSGMSVDRNPPTSAIFVDPNGNRVANPQAGQDLILADKDFFPNQVTEWVPDGDSNDSQSMGQGIGGSCAGDGVVTGPGQAQLEPSSYCARVNSAGFAPHAALRLAAGYFVTERIALAAIMRLQLSSGVSALNNLLLGVRGEYALSTPRSEGFFPSLFFGATVGQIQAQPGYSVDNPEAPWIKSGLMGIHVGANFRLRIHKNFGFIVGPEVDLQFPDVMFNVDLPLGVEAAF